MLVSLTLAGALVATQVQTTQETWSVVAGPDGGRIAVHRSSVVQDPDGTVRYVTMSPLTGDVSDGTYQATRWTVDCRAMTFQVEYGFEYRPGGLMLRRDMAPVPFSASHPRELPQGSTVFEAAEAVCTDRWGDRPPQPSAPDAYRPHHS